MDNVELQNKLVELLRLLDPTDMQRGGDVWANNEDAYRACDLAQTLERRLEDDHRVNARFNLSALSRLDCHNLVYYFAVGVRAALGDGDSE